MLKPETQKLGVTERGSDRGGAGEQMGSAGVKEVKCSSKCPYVLWFRNCAIVSLHRSFQSAATALGQGSHGTRARSGGSCSVVQCQCKRLPRAVPTAPCPRPTLPARVAVAPPLKSVFDVTERPIKSFHSRKSYFGKNHSVNCSEQVFIT